MQLCQSVWQIKSFFFVYKKQQINCFPVENFSPRFAWNSAECLLAVTKTAGETFNMKNKVKGCIFLVKFLDFPVLNAFKKRQKKKRNENLIRLNVTSLEPHRDYTRNDLEKKILDLEPIWVISEVKSRNWKKVDLSS